MAESVRETWIRFHETAKRIGVSPNRTAASLLIRWMDEVADALRAEVLRGEIRVRHRYKEEVRMPRPARKPAAAPKAAPMAQEVAAEAASLDALESLPDLPELPAPDLLAELPDMIPVQGLDSLAEGVTPAAIGAAIQAVTGGGSSGTDAVVSKAILDLKGLVEKVVQAQTVLDNRLVSLETLIQKSTTGLAQRVEELGTETRQGVMGVQATIRQVLDFLESPEEEEGAPAPVAAPRPAPSAPVATPQDAQILAAVAPGLAAKGNPAYPASAAVWEALAALCVAQKVQVSAADVEGAFMRAGRIEGGRLTY